MSRVGNDFATASALIGGPTAIAIYAGATSAALLTLGGSGAFILGLTVVWAKGNQAREQAMILDSQITKKRAAIAEIHHKEIAYQNGRARSAAAA